MSTRRTFDVPWPVVVVIVALLTAGSAFGVGALLFEDPATRKSYPNKTVAGFLKTTSGTVEIQTMPQPTEGQVLIAGCGTSSVTSTSVATCAKFGASPGGSDLPPGTPGQVPTISAITETGTVVATGTQTAITTGTATYTTTASQTAQIGTATIVVTFTQGATQTTTGTGTGSYSYTSTGTVTTTGTEYTTKNGTVDFDMAGVYFVGSAPSEGSAPGPGEASTGRWMRWRTMRDEGSLQYLTYAGTCSSGSDALIMTMTDNGSYWGGYASSDMRELWPAGNWLASLRAKVSANGAAIRVEVWRDAYYGEAYDAQLFNWTTESFTNTDFAVVSKMSVQPEFVPISSQDQIMFKLYATCSASTTVTVDVGTKSNGWASRIYSPFAINRVHSTDIPHYGSTSSVGAELSYLSNLLGGAIEDISTLDEQKEEVTWGTPGQFVKFIGTGTSATTSKGGVTVSIPTPITTRVFSVSANDFSIGIGAAASNVQAVAAAWTLRDGQNDQIYGAIMDVPSDYSSGMTVAPVWSPSATDSNSAHLVRWSLSYDSLASGTISFTTKNWSGTACGSNCTADYLVKEGASSALTVSAGTSYTLYLQRDHASGSDTYVGDVRLVALIFSYTSSL